MDEPRRDEAETGRGPIRAAVASGEMLVSFGAEHGVPECVRTSDFGCPNCLWAGVECKRGELYRPAITRTTGEPSCMSYAYCD